MMSELVNEWKCIENSTVGNRELVENLNSSSNVMVNLTRYPVLHRSPLNFDAVFYVLLFRHKSPIFSTFWILSNLKRIFDIFIYILMIFYGISYILKICMSCYKSKRTKIIFKNEMNYWVGKYSCHLIKKEV